MRQYRAGGPDCSTWWPWPLTLTSESDHGASMQRPNFMTLGAIHPRNADKASKQGSILFQTWINFIVQSDFLSSDRQAADRHRCIKVGTVGLKKLMETSRQLSLTPPPSLSPSPSSPPPHLSVVIGAMGFHLLVVGSNISPEFKWSDPSWPPIAYNLPDNKRQEINHYLWDTTLGQGRSWVICPKPCPICRLHSWQSL